MRDRRKVHILRMTRSSRGGTGRRPRGRRHRPPRLAHGGQVPTAPGWPRPTPPRLARGGRRTHRDAPCTPVTPCLARGSDSWHRRVRPRRGRAHYDPDGDRRRTGAPGAGRRYPSGALRPEGRARRGVDARGRRVRTGGGPPPGGPGSSRADCGNAASSDGSGASAEKLLPARAGVLHGQRRRQLLGHSSSRPVRGCCTLEGASRAGRFGLFLAIPGLLLERRFLVDGLPCAERIPLHMGGLQRR